MMTAKDSEPASTEDPPAPMEEEQEEQTDLPPTIPSSSPLIPTTVTPNVVAETGMEPKAVSVASNDCSTALSSPVEASPAKSTVTLPTTFDGTVETSPDTSHIASASDSLTSTGVDLFSTSGVHLTLQHFLGPTPAPTTFGNRDQEKDFPNVLTYKGVSVTLENSSVWKQFHRCGTEMILAKQGRRMFPYCRYRLAGLDPDQMYSLVLSIVPSDPYKYRWHDCKWEIIGQAEQQAQGLIRAFAHHNSPCRGSEWMGSLVSFYKLKLTNNPQIQDGHITLNSMQCYIPRIHVIPVPDGGVFHPDEPVVVGPESMTFTFPQTEFMTVTTYQNFRITQLKINHNPFAKGFREDGNNPRLQRIPSKINPVVKLDVQSTVLIPAVINDSQEAVDLSPKNETTPPSASADTETRLVLKPIMSTSSSKDDQYVPCIRGNHALGDLVVVEKHPPVEAEEEPNAATVTPKIRKGFRFTHKAISRTSSFKTSTPASSRGYHKRRKRINKRWANSRGRLWKATAASPTVVHSPSLTVAMQPELDDVEGLLFVSFTSKEALDVHAVNKPANTASFASPVAQATSQELKKTEEITETNEEKITNLEAVLLKDLKVFKHGQVIHPVLQEVGLKLTSLSQTQPVNLQYLGVLLPLPSPNVPEKDNAPAPGEGLSFISRTGKTNDVTKIKGWRNKFIKNKETSSNCDGSQKNLSAFCSNMLDEYLESEAQYISERAAAFSTNPEGAVSYQLPAKSSSYVKTLDSVLKHRNASSKLLEVAQRPFPQPHQDTPSSGLTSAPPLSSHAESPSTQQSASIKKHPGGGIKKSQRQPKSTLKQLGLTKSQSIMMQLERRVLTEGPYKTLLTPDRVSMALSTILTKQMRYNVHEATEYATSEAEGPECGQDFCRLGCVCSSLKQPNRGPQHCRQLECMFSCLCFKSKISKQTGTEESQQNDPVHSMPNMEHVVQTSLGSHARKLWNRNIFDEDTDPLVAPKMAPLLKIMTKVPKRNVYPRSIQPIREEEKDPVYKYFENMMTCARVREFNSKSPAEVTKHLIPNTSAPRSTEKPQEMSANVLLKKCLMSFLNAKKSGNKSQGPASDAVGVKKKIEIQSACSWDKDRRKILEVLYRRMNKDRLSHRFWIGPYRIRPIAKISMQKPTGTVITYRVNISLPSKPSHSGESDDSDEENYANESLLGNSDEELDSSPVGVAPFLTGLTPAGRLRVRTKPVGCEASGLIQVNGKSYNQARLLLGNMGALHPANRLAAYVTGRLRAPARVSVSSSQKSDPATKITPLSGLHIKTEGAEVSTAISARKTTDLKTPVQLPANVLHTEEKRKESVNPPDNSPNYSSVNPIQSFIEKQTNSASLFQSISPSSPVSLTVSPSLKTPSFLTKSGTYSFRICPPANQETEGKKQPGVPLPGGFTIIQLPKPKRDGAALQPQSANTRHPSKKADSQTPKRSAPTLDVKWLDIFARAKEIIKSAEPGAFTRQMFDEKMRSAENEKVKAWRTGSNLDIMSDDLSSDFSDFEREYYEDGEDEDQVDIETVVEEKQGMVVAKMKEVVRNALQDSRDSSQGFGILSELAKSQLEEQIDAMSSNTGGQSKHTVLERKRRHELRDLFDKLQDVLQSDPKAPRSRLLSLAVEEIQHLSETSQSLEKEKHELAQKRSLYMEELSALSGETDELIRDTLDEIDEKQRMREKTDKFRPLFSYLLQTRAALLEATALKSKNQPHTQSDSVSRNFSKLHPFVAAAINSVSEKPATKPSYGPLAVFPDALLHFNAPPEKKQSETQASDQGEEHQVEAAEQQELMVSTPESLTESLPKIPPVEVTPQIAKAPPVSISQRTKKPIAKPLPLIRSKTGRIILPASLKPLGQGYYTLTFMNQDKKEEDKLAKIKPATDKPPQTNQHQDSRTTQISDTVQTSTPQPKPSSSSLPTPLVLFSKPSFVPLTDPKVAMETSSPSGAARLTVEHVHPTPTVITIPSELSPTLIKPVPDPSPPVVRRGRGRPRKHPLPEKLQTTVACENNTSLLVGEIKTENETVEVTKPQAANTPPPAKRGRGRPRKDQSKSEPLWRPQRYLAKHSLSPESEGYSPERFSDSVECKEETPLMGNVSTSRHLTRGALGKDFPSAKKRSWIDVEKELEPEFDYE
ncbi:uncharacterized protein mgab isoform X2 [Halichoeres trimaculatus]|uniref:uncharacterized protein mgab isoform X2 n=1 Tax=Halichoeres trimaculatus TaxID=147232 RepID=UPI003D9E3A32